jgi:hypothetical protein
MNTVAPANRSPHDNPEFIGVIAQDYRANVAAAMDPTSRGFSMRLEPGASLESQCNTNYAYLNQQGISMAEYVGILSDVAVACRQGAPRRGFGDPPTAFDGPENLQVTRADGRLETIGYRGTLSGPETNPVTGERIWGHPNYFFTVRPPAVGSETYEDSVMSLWFGFTDMELEMARYGIFGARIDDSRSSQASCRAEELLKRIRNTETGQQVLAQRAASQPLVEEQPIELLPEPRPEETATPAAKRGLGALALVGRVFSRFKK